MRVGLFSKQVGYFQRVGTHYRDYSSRACGQRVGVDFVTQALGDGRRCGRGGILTCTPALDVAVGVVGIGASPPGDGMEGSR